MVIRKKLPIAIGVIAVAVVALMAASWVGASTKASVRSQTLITGGKQWGTVNGFNPYNGQGATCVVGCVYETLLRYNPLNDTYIPWLATSAGFSGHTYTIHVRSGVKWSDGTALTGADVAFTLNLGTHATAFWANLLAETNGAVATGNTVKLVFKKTPDYQQFQNAIWNIPIVQKKQWASHIKAGAAGDAAVTGYLATPTSVPVGTGPYTVDHAGTGNGTVEVKYDKKATWWATSAVKAPSPKPKWIVDLVNSSNNVALGYVIHGDEDLNNNYLPGITQLLASGYGIQTYYPTKPYDLAANTAWLVPNTTRKPMNLAAFRRALAWGVNPQQVVTGDYGNLVQKANPTGLLHIWDKYINAAEVKANGFHYNPATATHILSTTAGFSKCSGKWWCYQGKKINLKLIVPQGWSDWMTAINMMSANLRAIGIAVSPSYPASFFTLRNAGTFDLLIDNSVQMSDTPWTYYNYMFNQPILAQQTFANFGRYKNNTGWALADQLDKTPVHATAAMNVIIKKIQHISLTQMPLIPLWYNGVWAQFTSQVWTNWPGSVSTKADPRSGHYMPCMWNGYLQMTAIDTIDHLKAA
ncbi:MAG: ABC transporter substrate-binding protein [Gaiellaceae bacterium]|jgi:peptide/nickel transport system substrate-binding protein